MLDGIAEVVSPGLGAFRKFAGVHRRPHEGHVVVTRQSFAPLIELEHEKLHIFACIGLAIVSFLGSGAAQRGGQEGKTYHQPLKKDVA